MIPAVRVSEAQVLGKSSTTTVVCNDVALAAHPYTGWYTAGLYNVKLLHSPLCVHAKYKGRSLTRRRDA